MEYYYDITFPELTFTSPGIYSYTIKELAPPGEGWTSDGRVYRVLIKVTDTGGGNLSASLYYPDGAPEFVNTYHKEDDILLPDHRCVPKVKTKRRARRESYNRWGTLL